MRRSSFAALLFAALAASGTARAQGIGAGESMPLVGDLKKAPVGSWAAYTMTVAMDGKPMTMNARWALVGRDAASNVLEMQMQGGMMAAMGGKITVKLVVALDPTVGDKPVKQMVMQMGDRDPMEMPTNIPQIPTQKFHKPDPKNLVGKETIKVAAGTFKTSHYRTITENGAVDAWVSEEAAPLGVVKVVSTPKPGAPGPGGRPMPAVTMELVGRGKDAKPSITKPAKPFDPAALMGAMGGGGHGQPGAGR